MKPRWKLAAILLALAAGSCAPASNIPQVPIRQVASDTLVSVADSLYDAGRGASVALDADGNPAVTYLLYSPVLKRGEIPPGVKVGEPQPPAIVMATQANGIWTRTSVTPQKTAPTAQGDAPELANDKNQAIPGVNTALAIDGQGSHHVMWATPRGVFYSTDASGAFGEKEQVTGSPALGGSIAVGGDGTVWVSYYDRDSVVAGTRTGAGWTRETVRPQTGQANAPASATSIRIGADGQPTLAFGEEGRTAVATRSADAAWSFEELEGDGGYGVSLSLDADGNPFVAYYDVQGVVHQASRMGGTWAVNEVATTAAGPNGTSDERWSTGVGVDSQGTSHVAFADTAQKAIVLATGDGTTFSPQRLPGSESGTTPALAVGPDGSKRAVAWFDGDNANLNVAQTGIEGLAIAHPTSAPAPPSPGATTPTEAPCEPTILEIAAINLAFDTDCLAAPAGEPFTIAFDNQEAVPHNVDVYDQQGGAHIAGAAPTDIFTGPGTVEYDSGPLEEGIYFFQCDVHPTQMFGTFVVGAP